MKTLILVVTVVFACMGFVRGPVQEVSGNPLYAYYVYGLKFAEGNLAVFGVGLMAISMGFWFKDRKLANALVQAGQVMLLGFLLSVVLLYVVAVVELNVLAMMFNRGPKTIGVVTDRLEIVETLKKFDRPPKIMASDKGQKAQLYAMAVASAGKGSFFANVILPSTPEFLIGNTKKADSGMLLIDDTLVITEVNPVDIWSVSPVVGHLLVKRYFPNTSIRAYPIVSIMDREEYDKFREKDFKAKLVRVDETLAEVVKKMEEVRVTIEGDEKNIATAQEEVKQGYAEIDIQYFKCLNSKNKPVCETEKVTRYETVSQINREADDWKAKLKEDQKLLAEQELYEAFYKSQQEAGETLASNVPQERGAFDPPEGLKLTMGNIDSPRAVADYLVTLTHEYLHYASYVGEDKKLADTFFEEGLAEYFARRAIKKELGVDTNLGYPIVVKIMAELVEPIPESDLAEVYFTKDQQKLEVIMDRVYGDGFYRENRIFFETLMFTSDARRILPLANVIMEKIGGEQLTVEDLLSTSSSLE